MWGPASAGPTPSQTLLSCAQMEGRASARPPWSPRPPCSPRSIHPHRPHRVDPGGAAGREIPGHECDGDHHGGRHRERGGVARRERRRAATAAALKRRAPARPTTIPIAHALSSWRRTRRRTVSRSAPSAMRTPSSCVRCDTEYAVTPNTPTAAMNSDSAAKPSSSTIVRRCWPTPRPIDFFHACERRRPAGLDRLNAAPLRRRRASTPARRARARRRRPTLT